MAWELKEALAYYRSQGAPGDQNALIALLREMQAEFDGIPQYLLQSAAEAYGIRETFLTALIRRIPSLRLADTHCLELCGGPNCGKHTELASFAEKYKEKSQEKVTVKYVPCMRMCGKGPNIRWDGMLYHQADEALLRKLLGL